MNKLIELLNKYLFEKGEKLVIKNYYNNDWFKDVGGEFRGVHLKDKKYSVDFIRGREVISKHYGFIKWLLDNDKIDRDKNVLAFEFSSVYTYDGENYEDHIKECKLLMLLAIQDEPIEFLISILK